MGFRFFWDFNGIFYEDLSWFPMIFRNAMAKMSPLRVNAELYGVFFWKTLGTFWDKWVNILTLGTNVSQHHNFGKTSFLG
jgi:hypothetical protein